MRVSNYLKICGLAAGCLGLAFAGRAILAKDGEVPRPKSSITSTFSVMQPGQARPLPKRQLRGVATCGVNKAECVAAEGQVYIVAEGGITDPRADSRYVWTVRLHGRDDKELAHPLHERVYEELSFVPGPEKSNPILFDSIPADLAPGSYVAVISLAKFQESNRAFELAAIRDPAFAKGFVGASKVAKFEVE